MRNLAIFFLGISLISCSTKSDGLVDVEETLLSFRTERLEKETCVGESCATLKLEWPIVSGPESASQINQAITDQMSFLVQTGEEIAPLDSMVGSFLRSFEEFKQEFPGASGDWEIEATGTPSYESDSTLSIYFSQFSYLGGAHPNSLVSFLNVDPKTGEVLSIDRLVRDEAGLLALAEQKFREHHEVEEGTRLEDSEQFFLPETGFFLANAMGFKDGKFWVIYVPYEIGPYVLGYTELEFTREELGSIVRW